MGDLESSVNQDYSSELLRKQALSKGDNYTYFMCCFEQGLGPEENQLAYESGAAEAKFRELKRKDEMSTEFALQFLQDSRKLPDGKARTVYQRSILQKYLARHFGVQQVSNWDASEVNLLFNHILQYCQKRIK